MKRILPFPRGRMKMTTVWNDEPMSVETEFELRTRIVNLQGQLIQKNAELIDKNERILDLMKRLSLSDFTRVVEETGVLDQKETQRRKASIGS